MKLSLKLSFILSILFLCISVVGMFSLYQMNTLNRVSTEMSQSWLPSTVLMQRIGTLSSDFRRFEMSHVFTEDMQAMDEYESKMFQILQQLYFNVDNYKKNINSPEENNLFASLNDLWASYMNTHTEIIRLSRTMQTQKAIELLHGTSSDLYDAYAKMLLHIVEQDVVMGERAGLSGNVQYANASMLMSVMLIVALLLAAGLGVFIVRDTLRNLGKDPAELGALARRVAEGDLSVPQDAQARGVYADILVMVEKLRHHIARVELLTANIPGGVHSCVFDEKGSTSYVSEGFLALCGYSREELRTLFSSQFVLLVWPQDKENMISSLRQQLAISDNFELEYRLKHKDGHAVWVLDRGRRVFDEKGEPQLYCVLIDVTELKRAQLQLIFQEERFRTVLCATHDFVFESDAYSFSLSKGETAWKHIFGGLPHSYADAYERALPTCHPDDQEVFSQTFAPERVNQAAEAGARTVSLEYRTRMGPDGPYEWFSCTIVPYVNAPGAADKLFGCLVNINERKQQERKILNSAQRDSLTGLFNKGHVEQDISDFLAGSGNDQHHALMVVDIDNFKSINDNLGHLFGDAVLKDVATSLGNTFRTTDTIGRIGGDEFVILLKQVAVDGDLITTKATDVCQALCRTFAGNGREYSISGSVGVALFPQDATSYRELFRKADAALYAAKSQGKSRYCFYEAVEATVSPGTVAPRGELTDIVRKTEARSFKDDILSYIFTLLYEAKDMGSIINIALGLIGEHYAVSRAYVVHGVSVYEWCNSAEGLQPTATAPISCADMGKFLPSYTCDGVLYCDNTDTLEGPLHDLLTQQGVTSMLHVATFEEGIITGFAGFDNCFSTRMWTKDEIETLSSLAKIFSIFLRKDDMARQLAASFADSNAVLDSLNVWAYVIDSQNHELLYGNAKIGMLDEDIRRGRTCHAAFFDRSEPCVDCPVADFMNGGCDTWERYNTRLGAWTLISATHIPWSDKRRAVLMCCTNISRYKSEAAVPV